MADKTKTSEKMDKIPMNLAPAGKEAMGKGVSITWDQSKPVTAGGTKSGGITVTCTLAGPKGSGTKTANIISMSSWDVDFGYVPPGSYTLTANGSDGSSSTVSISVT